MNAVMGGGLIGVVVGLGVAGMNLVQVLGAMASRSWPSVQGEVLSCSVRTTQNPDSGGSATKAAVQYSYSVSGRSFTGDVVRFGDALTGDDSSARLKEVTSRFAAGRKVPVHY